MTEVAISTDKPAIKIKHADLESRGTKTQLARICPTCKEGTLLMHRNPTSLVLKKDDYCILCGQSYEYTDIEDVRNQDWAGGE
jgi:uncharacterized protein (DUF983 family)